MSGVLGRVRAAPLAVHAVALALVLFALLPLARPQTVFFADEGSGLAQAKQLADGDGWSRPPSFPEADPENRSYPLFNSLTRDPIVPLGHHPVYALVVEPWYAAYGIAGAAALSIVGLVAASLFSGCCARRLRPGLGAAAVWVVGISSPLFVDGYLVVAHTLGAACVAAAVLSCLRFVGGERRVLMAIAALTLTVASALLRNEAILFFAALGIVLLALGRDASSRVLGIALGGAAVASRLLESRIRSHVVGQQIGQFSVSEGGHWLTDHAFAALVTVVGPSYSSFGVSAVVLVLAVACGVAAAVVARTNPDDRGGFRLFAGLAVGLLVARLFFASGPVPGLVLAFPILPVGLACSNRDVFGRWDVRLLSATFLVFAGAVLVTQYGGAGGREWGWRYVAIALPLIVPVVLVLLVDGASRLGTQERTLAARLLVVMCVATGALGFLALRDTRADNEVIVDGIREAYASTPAGDGGKPVVVTTQAGTIDRFNWDHVDDTRWLVVDPKDRSQISAYLDRIARLGVRELTFVSTVVDKDRAFVAARGDIVGETELPDRHVLLRVRLRA